MNVHDMGVALGRKVSGARFGHCFILLSLG